MTFNKLFELLSYLSNRQWRALIEFATLKSNGLKEVDNKVLEYSAKHKKLLLKQPAQLEKQLLKQFFDNNKLKAWNYTKSRLITVVNRYFVIQQIEQHPLLKNQLLLEHHYNNQLNKNFEAQYNKSKKELEQSKKDFDHQYYLFKLQEQQLKQRQEQRKLMEELLVMKDALDNFYIENRIRLQLEIQNRSRIIQAPIPNDFFSNIDLDIIDLKTINSKIYYHLYGMIRSPDNASFYDNVNLLLSRYEAKFTTEYKEPIYTYLLNYCIYKYQKGDVQFAKKYIKHIQEMIETGLISKTQRLSINKYTSAIFLALVSNQLDWTENFIAEYSKYVQHDRIDAIKDLNLATVLFHKGKNDEALQKLTTFNFSEMYFKILYDKLCIKLYYEEGLDIPLENKLDAFAKYIYRSDKLSEERKVKNKKFIKAVRKLDEYRMNQIKLNASDYLYQDYIWLNKKIKGK